MDSHFEWAGLASHLPIELSAERPFGASNRQPLAAEVPHLAQTEVAPQHDQRQFEEDHREGHVLDGANVELTIVGTSVWGDPKTTSNHGPIAHFEEQEPIAEAVGARLHLRNEGLPAGQGSEYCQQVCRKPAPVPHPAQPMGDLGIEPHTDRVEEILAPAFTHIKAGNLPPGQSFDGQFRGEAPNSTQLGKIVACARWNDCKRRSLGDLGAEQAIGSLVQGSIPAKHEDSRGTLLNRLADDRNRGTGAGCINSLNRSKRPPGCGLRGRG